MEVEIGKWVENNSWYDMCARKCLKWKIKPTFQLSTFWENFWISVNWFVATRTHLPSNRAWEPKIWKTRNFQKSLKIEVGVGKLGGITWDMWARKCLDWKFKPTFQQSTFLGKFLVFLKAVATWPRLTGNSWQSVGIKNKQFGFSIFFESWKPALIEEIGQHLSVHFSKQTLMQ